MKPSMGAFSVESFVAAQVTPGKPIPYKIVIMT